MGHIEIVWKPGQTIVGWSSYGAFSRLTLAPPTCGSADQPSKQAWTSFDLKWTVWIR